MTTQHTRRPALQNDLYIRSEELSGQPALDADSDRDIEKNADELVRQLLVEEKRRVMPERLPEIAPQEEVIVFDSQDPDNLRESPRESIAQILKAERATGAQTRAPFWKRAKLPQMRLPHLSVPSLGLRLPRLGKTRGKSATAVEASASGERDSAARRTFGLALLRGYRPTRKHVLWALFAALVLYRPLLVPLIVLLLIWVVVIAYLTVGPDRWGEIISAGWHRLHARRPEMAERLRARADVFAERFDHVLDWLPESWADRLALPDFSGTSHHQDNAPDPFDRLAGEARQG